MHTTRTLVAYVGHVQAAYLSMLTFYPTYSHVYARTLRGHTTYTPTYTAKTSRQIPECEYASSTTVPSTYTYLRGIKQVSPLAQLPQPPKAGT